MASMSTNSILCWKPLSSFGFILPTYCLTQEIREILSATRLSNSEWLIWDQNTQQSIANLGCSSVNIYLGGNIIFGCGTKSCIEGYEFDNTFCIEGPTLHSESMWKKENSISELLIWIKLLQLNLRETWYTARLVDEYRLDLPW